MAYTRRQGIVAVGLLAVASLVAGVLVFGTGAQAAPGEVTASEHVPPSFTACPDAVAAPVSSVLGFDGDATTFSVATSGSSSFSSIGPASLSDNGDGTANLAIDPNLADWLFDLVHGTTQAITASNPGGTATCTTMIDIILFVGPPVV